MKKPFVIFLILSNLALYPLLFFSFLTNQRQTRQLSQYLAYVEQQLQQTPTTQDTPLVPDGKEGVTTPPPERENSWERRVIERLMQDDYIKTHVKHSGTLTTFLRYKSNGMLESFSLPNTFLNVFSDWSIIPDDSDFAEPFVYTFQKPFLGPNPYSILHPIHEETIHLTFTTISTTAKSPEPICAEGTPESLRFVTSLFMREGGDIPQKNPCGGVRELKTIFQNQIEKSGDTYHVFRLGTPPSDVVRLMIVRDPNNPEAYPLQALYIQLQHENGWPFDPEETTLRARQEKMETLVDPLIDHLQISLCEYACAY